VASLIRGAAIDVLIDCGGWGDLGTLGICARRPAPLQVKWVGAQNQTTGLPEIDLFLTDHWETPAGSEPLCTEKLLRLADGYVCYAPRVDAPEVGPLPALSGGGVTFGCFNNLAKITPRVIATWAAILQRVPSARLLLKTQQFSDVPTCDAMRATFAMHGIDAARLVLHGITPHQGHLALHQSVDIVLDPFPYSGGLTTCESLWMGVPVLTLPGTSFAARHSASHLSNAGLADWIAPDIASYVEMAVSRAADISRLARLRAELRPMVKASPLTDAPRFGAHLGEALRAAWVAACEA
jgi:predicted O-linked N-acetylglucosamine transferase (SPINDLY family)